MFFIDNHISSSISYVYVTKDWFLSSFLAFIFKNIPNATPTTIKTKATIITTAHHFKPSDESISN